MFIGVIRNRDILLNPVSIIKMRGLKGYLKLVWRAFSRKPYAFIPMTQDSQWFFDKSVVKKQAKGPKRQKRSRKTTASPSGRSSDRASSRP